MLIAQISDTHILARTSEHPSVHLRTDCLRLCIDDINKQQPDAVIFTGDTVQTGERQEYQHLRDLLESLDPPLYLVPGNRDNNQTLRAVLNDALSLPENLSGKSDIVQYTVEDHAVRLIAIDSTDPGERKGVFCPVRQAWLDTVLSEQPDRPTLLFIHHPPFDIEDHYIGGYRRPEEADMLANIVSRHPQVQGLVCGHVHRPVDCQWAGTRAIVMPSVAVDLRKDIDEAVAQQRPIYMLHRLSTEKGLVSEARTVGAAM
jgi:Icc protein